MSHHDIRSAERPEPDRVLVDIARYARDARDHRATSPTRPRATA